MEEARDKQFPLRSWYSIVSAAVGLNEKPERDRRVARYMSENRVLMRCIAKGNSRYKFARKVIVSDVSVEMVGFTTDLDSSKW